MSRRCGQASAQIPGQEAFDAEEHHQEAEVDAERHDETTPPILR